MLPEKHPWRILPKYSGLPSVAKLLNNFELDSEFLLNLSKKLTSRHTDTGAAPSALCG